MFEFGIFPFQVVKLQHCYYLHKNINTHKIRQKFHNKPINFLSKTSDFKQFYNNFANRKAGGFDTKNTNGTETLLLDHKNFLFFRYKNEIDQSLKIFSIKMRKSNFSKIVRHQSNCDKIFFIFF